MLKNTNAFALSLLVGRKIPDAVVSLVRRDFLSCSIVSYQTSAPVIKRLQEWIM